MSDPNSTPKPPSAAARLFGQLLEWTLNTGARALAKGLESVADDAQQAIKSRASEIEQFGKGVAEWRARNLGDVGAVDGDDLPDSLRGNGSRNNGSTSTRKTEVQS